MSKYSPNEMLEYIRAEKLETELVLALFCNEKDYIPIFGEIKSTEKGFMFHSFNRPKLLEVFMKQAIKCQKAAVPDETIFAELSAELDDDYMFVETENGGVPVEYVYEQIVGKVYVKTCLVYAGDSFYILADVWNNAPEEDVASRHMMERIFLDFLERNNINTKGRLKALLETAEGQYNNFRKGQAYGISKGFIKKI